MLSMMIYHGCDTVLFNVHYYVPLLLFLLLLGVYYVFTNIFVLLFLVFNASALLPVSYVDILILYSLPFKVAVPLFNMFCNIIVS